MLPNSVSRILEIRPPDLQSDLGIAHLSREANPQGRASIAAEAPDVSLLDRLACAGFEFDHVVAVSQEDGGDSNCSGSVRYRSAELSTIALVVHLPTHAPTATRVGRCNTDLHQSPCGQAAAEAVERAAFDEPADDRSRRDTATVDLSVVGSIVLPSGSVSCGAPPNVGGPRRRLGRCPLSERTEITQFISSQPLNRMWKNSVLVCRFVELSYRILARVVGNH